MSKLKQEYQDKKQKPEVIKSFSPKITAAIPKNGSNKVTEIKTVIELNKINDNKSVEESLPVHQPIVPPKPLPRASRASSVCEQLEENNGAAKPVARPRTNSCAPIGTTVTVSSTVTVSPPVTTAPPVVTSVNPNMPVTGGYKVYEIL